MSPIQRIPTTAPLKSCAPPVVSVIIVNYNGKHFLEACLRSLERQTYPRARFEVFVVDNASTDGSIEYLRRHHPDVHVIASPANLGFAQGNNVGLQQARGDFVALLNNDTEVAPQWLEALVEAIQAGPRIGGVGSKILFLHQPNVINSVGLNLYRDGRGGDRGFRELDRGQFEEPAEVFGVCGASVLLRRTMLDEIGLFDERFFMYYEDLDLAWRARLRGWSFRYAPKSVAHHVHCGSAGEWSPFFLYHVERNRVFVHLKNGTWRQALRAGLVFGARALRKWFWVLTLQQRTARDRAEAAVYGKALVSLVTRLPEMLRQRWRIRRTRVIRDAELVPLISPKP